MEDSFLNDNRISCLVSERKNGIFNYFLKKTIVEFTKTTKKNKGHIWELLGITQDL